MSDHETIGKTVVEYAENGRHIACLKKQLADIGDHLTLLGEQLRDAPLSVAVRESAIEVTRSSRMVPTDYVTSIPVMSLDKYYLNQIIEELRGAEQLRERLERTLKGMRLEHLIQN